MRKLFFLILSFLILGTSLIEAGKPRVGQQFPDFSGKTSENRRVSLSDYNGKVTLVVFWATWCGPCRQKVPSLKQLYTKYNSQGLEIIGISVDKTPQDISRFHRQMGMDWESIFDGGNRGNQLASKFGINGIPQTFLIDQKGILVGDNLSSYQLDEKISSLLRTKSSKGSGSTLQGLTGSSSEPKANPLLKKNNTGNNSSSGSGEIVIEFVDRLNAEEQTFETIFRDFQRSSPSARKEMSAELKKMAVEDPKVAMNCAEEYLATNIILSDVSMELADVLNQSDIPQDIAYSDTVAYAYYRGGYLTKALSIQSENLKVVDDRVKALPEGDRDVLVKQILSDYGYMRMVTRLALYHAKNKQPDQARKIMQRFKYSENLPAFRFMSEYNELQDVLAKSV